MFELTNEQRKCFGLPPVGDTWERVSVKASPYDDFETCAYLDGRHVRRVILISTEPEHEKYCEYQIEAELSEDGKRLLPKTGRGKEKSFTSSNLLKTTAAGMALLFSNERLTLENRTSERCFYRSDYDGVTLNDFAAFARWVEDWCAATGERQLREIEAFAAAKRTHQKYREGDFFRFRINRELYGYGRILLDFARMRKEGIPFWDIFMGKPLCAAVYHIATERDDVSPSELAGLPMLPSQMIMDNVFFYGECEIIGNAPLKEEERDYPIHYGRPLDPREKGLRCQCGRTYIVREEEEPLYDGFTNNAIGWQLRVRLPILQRCIAEKSNGPYWELSYPIVVMEDLRDPKHAKELAEIRRQLGME